MPHKDLNTSVTVPLLLLLASLILGHLLLNYQKLETSLYTYLPNIISVRLLVTSCVLLILLSPFYAFQKTVKIITPKEREMLSELIRSSVESQWSLHQRNILNKQLKEIVNKEASRGFPFPTGRMYGKISVLYVSGIGIFSKFLEEAIVKIPTDQNINKLSAHKNDLIETMLNQQRSRLTATFTLLIKNYFSGSNSYRKEIIIKSFESKITTETTLQIKRIQSKIELHNAS